MQDIFLKQVDIFPTFDNLESCLGKAEMVAVVASGVDTPGHARTGELCSGRADGAADWWLYMRHLAVLETLATRASAGNKMVIVKLREREGQRVDPGRSLKGHLWMVDGGWWISFP